MANINSETTLEFPKEVMLTSLEVRPGTKEHWFLQSLDVYNGSRYDERTFSGTSLETCKKWLAAHGYVSKYGEFSGDFTYVRKEN